TAYENAYEKDADQARFSCYEAYLFDFTKWKLTSSFQFREELIDSEWNPLIFSAGFDKLLPFNLKLKAAVARNYRTPSLNDLYWTPGGNPDLLPENGLSEEISLMHDLLKTSFSNKATITFYHHDIQNQITWLPDLVYWAPKNVHTL